MRKEYIEYFDNLPINIQLATIGNYPLYWKDSIEIIFVLSGSIEVGIDSYRNVLTEREIEIINVDEVRWLKKTSEDNLVIIMDVDPSFFEKYYKDAESTLYYTRFDSINGARQDSGKYHKLRKFLSVLLFEVVAKLDDYEENVNENLLKMMYFLLNNFHYLFYEGENLEEDQVQLQRYHRIIDYLNKNYMHKVTLQEIADMEYLSSQYLSYKIKDTFGLSFNEYLNQIRVDESIKLLLTTDRSISDISESVGFSHVRYFNRHFKLNYETTPSNFRKQYKLTEEEFEEKIDIKYHDLEDALEYLDTYLHDYDRYNYDDEIFRIEIDLEKESLGEFKKPSIINLGDASYLLEDEHQNMLEEIQREIQFEYGLISNLFSSDMNIFIGKNDRFINWTKVEQLMYYLYTLNINPIIDTKGTEKHVIDSFIEHFESIYPVDIETILDEGFKNTKPRFLKEEINENYDTILMVPFIIDSYLNSKDRLVLDLVDEISKETELSNDTFFGGRGLFTNNGLNKASYYAFMMLSFMEGDIVDEGPGYLLTKSQGKYQLLVYNPPEADEDYIYGEREENIKLKQISMNIYNMNGDFSIIKYSLDRYNGSPYDKWIYLGRPERLDYWHRELLKRYVHPKVSYFFRENSMVLNILTKIKDNGVVLYIFEEI